MTGRGESGAPTATGVDLDAVFPGPGEMAVRCRAFDWAATPLGPVSEWSASLRTTAGLVLGSRQPMFLFWGPELVQIHNDAYRPSLGVGGRADLALGARGRDFWTDIWDVIGPQIDQVMRTGEPTWHEDQHLPIERNGRLEDVWWTYSYSPVRDDDGRIAATLVVCMETTGRVLADRALARERARLAEVFQRSPSFLAVVRGPDNVFELVNDAYEQIVGRGRDVQGRPLFEALPETREQGFEAYLARVRATGQPLVFRELPVLLDRTPGAAREERFLDVTYLPLVEADGTHDAVIAHGADVTEQVLARRAAEAANRAKSDFLSTMSHELRTPLNAILGYVDLLTLGVRGPLSDAQREDLERVRRAGQYLQAIISDVLNYARLEAGRVQYHLEDVLLDRVVADVEAMIAPQVRARGLTFTHAVCAPDGPESSLRVRADAEKLRQILLNLLVNSIKFTEPGGHIALQCDRVDADGAPLVRVCVTDTGHGIAADHLERIFDAFVQVDRNRTADSLRGVGLGLAISRDLARGMGGDLIAESAPGTGSTFTLILPRA